MRISYLQWLGSCLNKTVASPKNNDILNPILVKIVEKAIQQPLQVKISSIQISYSYLSIYIFLYTYSGRRCKRRTLRSLRIIQT